MTDGIVERPTYSLPAQAHAYATLQHLESELRRFIIGTMSRRFGPDWEKQRVPPVLNTRWRRRAHERMSKPYPWLHPIENICELADFSDCKEVIQWRPNWGEVFEPIFHDIAATVAKLDELYAIRNEVTHMRPLTPEALLKLHSIADDIIRSIHGPT